MAKAIFEINGQRRGIVSLGLHGGNVGTVRQQVHDGDTINVRAQGNLSIRMLGIDTPETSFQLPGSNAFASLDSPAWEAFLSDPTLLDGFNPPLDLGLRAYLQGRVGPGAARNQKEHARAAERALEQEITNDMAALGQTKETFEFFLAFAHEIMEGFGRLLCFINRNQPHPTQPSPRPASYNERLLEQGVASPYFIWPNVNPFRRQGRIGDAVPTLGTANDVAQQESALRRARQFVQAARANGIGLFDPANPLRLEPFEVRFLARRRPPNRWLIDLSRNDHFLIRPQNYYQVPNPEDRLFVSEEHVDLFMHRGWRLQP